MPSCGEIHMSMITVDLTNSCVLSREQELLPLWNEEGVVEKVRQIQVPRGNTKSLVKICYEQDLEDLIPLLRELKINTARGLAIPWWPSCSLEDNPSLVKEPTKGIIIYGRAPSAGIPVRNDYDWRSNRNKD